jgi:hypothetical protein
MITQQTFEYRCNDEELEVISAALDLMRQKRYIDAQAVLIARHDKLTAKPILKQYNQHEARA